MGDAPIGEGPVEHVRTFGDGVKMGVGSDKSGRFWIYDQPGGREFWHKHTGPFLTRGEAVERIRESRDHE